MMTKQLDDAGSQPGEVSSSAPLGLVPAAWMGEFVTACESTETQFYTEDPEGLRFGDAGEPSPFRVTPLYDKAAIDAAVAAERERWRNAVSGAVLMAESHSGRADDCGRLARAILDAYIMGSA